MSEAKQAILNAMDELGLTVESKFIPWSQSRNKSEEQPSLNWSVTVKRNGREVLTTDYSAGYGHCPSYKAPVLELGHQNSVMRMDAVKRECETGNSNKLAGRNPIKPDSADVVHSLVSDSDVLECSGFEEWATNLGYDTDSRKADTIYRSCLEITIKLRASLGEEGLAKLREACQDY